jgi:hypothetical protein
VVRVRLSNPEWIDKTDVDDGGVGPGESVDLGMFDSVVISHTLAFEMPSRRCIAAQFLSPYWRVAILDSTGKLSWDMKKSPWYRDLRVVSA